LFSLIYLKISSLLVPKRIQRLGLGKKLKSNSHLGVRLRHNLACQAIALAKAGATYHQYASASPLVFLDMTKNLSLPASKENKTREGGNLWEAPCDCYSDTGIQQLYNLMIAVQLAVEM